MHSSDALPPAPATGPQLLQQVGRLIIRARSPGNERKRTKNIQPSTSQQVSVSLQPKPEPRPAVEAQLESHVEALWTEQIPICIEVLLSPDCQECHARLSRVESEASYDKSPSRRGMLLERWTLSVVLKKNHESLSSISSQWMLSAVRSQLHFSQLAAWLARIAARPDRRRKSSRETCNFKKLEANCDDDDLKDEALNRKLNVIYSIKIPGESYKMSDFTRTPTDHTFPVTDIGNNAFLKVYLESLPRIEEIPIVKCMCNTNQPKRRASKEMPANAHEEIASRMGDLTLGPSEARFKDVGVINSNIGFASGVTRRLSIFGNSSNEYFRVGTPEKDETLVDDRMHTPCSESGKHKCSCDDESDQGKENVALKQETKKLDERRLKEIAKYKRRLRKENKLRKLSSNSESTGNSEGEIPKKRDETHTSIPILQAARFDRLRAIGCYRNQTYLTLPASRIDTKSPFLTDNINIPTPEYKKTNTVSTQTDDLRCSCGSNFVPQCEACAPKATKHKCDNFSNSLMCDINSVVGNVRELVAGVKRDEDGVLIKRPKLKRFFPIVDRLERLMTDRFNNRQGKRDIDELHLKDDDSVFAGQSEMRTPLEKRKKNSSIGDEYVLLESCDYGTFDKCDGESPTVSSAGFDFETAKDDQGNDCHGKDCHGKDGNDNQGKDTQGKDTQGKDGPGKDNQVPSPTEMDRFRWRFDSAASMVFHNKTGLPLTSSPAPLKRGKNCFDYDASINGISGIKSALFQPVATAPPPPRPAPPPRAEHHALLGSFEESALKGRLEPVATVHGFTAELAASGSFCPPHRRLPVTVFFYAPGGTNAPYMGHINLGTSGYRVPSSGTIQVSLFNPHGTLVKMFVVLYSLIGMPPSARTFLRQRTLYLPAGAPEPRRGDTHKYMRYLIHLRFMTSKSGKLYLHTDIRIIVSRKADMDTAAAHTPIHKPLPTNHSAGNTDKEPPANQSAQNPGRSTNGTPCRVFGGSSDYKDFEIGYDNGSGVSYELRSFTYGPENPKYSPR